MICEGENMPAPRSAFIQRLIRWRLLFVVNLLVIIFLGLSLSREVVRSRAINAQITDLKEQAEGLSARNIDLSQLKTAMQTSTFIEREARLKLGMKKPGETVLVIQEAQPSAGEQSEDDLMDASDPLDLVLDGKESEVAIANPSKWWYYFFDKKSFNALVEYE